MSFDEQVEYLPIAQNSSLPPSQRATLYVELTPFLSRNNRPNSIAERIPCISILNRLKRSGVTIPPGHDLRKCEGINDVSASIAGRILHELKVAGEVAVQVAATNGMVMSAITKAVEEGHNVMISYTDAYAYTGVPEHEAKSFVRMLASIQVRIAKLMSMAAASRLYLAREVKYSRLRYHGDTQLHIAVGARKGIILPQRPYLRPWIALFDQALNGELDPSEKGLNGPQIEALRDTVFISQHDDEDEDDDFDLEEDEHDRAEQDA